MSDFQFEQPVETKLKRGPANANPPPRSNPTRPAPAAAPIETQQEAAAQGGAPEGGDKPKYDPEELSRIFDEIIFQGEYSEEVIIKGKLRVRFKTRSADEVEQISRVVDAMTANLVATLAEKRAILNLQYALVSYNGRPLSAGSVEERAAFVKKIPAPVIGALFDALGRFDDKVYAACRDGEENF